MTAAGSRSGTCHIFQSFQILVAHLARCVGTDRFEHILNGDVLAAKTARSNRPAVVDDARNIQSRQGHGRGWNRLIAADNRHNCVKHLSATNQLDRIGNQLAADQRRAHSLRAHCFAVGNRNRIEFHRRAARRANSFFHLGGDAPQMKIAGHGFNPGIRHANQGLA